jgi:hypothetical protein
MSMRTPMVTGTAGGMVTTDSVRTAQEVNADGPASRGCNGWWSFHNLNPGSLLEGAVGRVTRDRADWLGAKLKHRVPPPRGENE